MYAILGTIIKYSLRGYDGPYEPIEEERIIALFSTKKLAEEYIAKSRLKQPIKKSFSSKKPFKQKSLLWDCTYVEIIEYEEPEYVVDPEL